MRWSSFIVDENNALLSCCKYILFDGLARNTGQYFTSCGRIFPSPVGARKNASNE